MEGLAVGGWRLAVGYRRDHREQGEDEDQAKYWSQSFGPEGGLLRFNAIRRPTKNPTIAQAGLIEKMSGNTQGRAPSRIPLDIITASAPNTPMAAPNANPAKQPIRPAELGLISEVGGWWLAVVGISKVNWSKLRE